MTHSATILRLRSRYVHHTVALRSVARCSSWPSAGRCCSAGSGARCSPRCSIRWSRPAVRASASRAGTTPITVGPAGSGTLVGATEYGGPGDPCERHGRILGSEPARQPGQLRRARRNDVPDRRRARRSSVRHAAADQLGRALGDRLQAGHRAGRRADRRAPARHRPVVGARPRARDPVREWDVVRARADRARRGRAGAIAGATAIGERGRGCRRHGSADCAALAQRVDSARGRSRARCCWRTGGRPRPRMRRLRFAGMIAAGNEIVGIPYVYGGGHGVPLDQIASSYDCSSSVEHLLYGGGLMPVGDTVSSRRSGVVRRSRPGPLGDHLRERRPRVHVCRRSAVGHMERRRGRGRDDGDRLASARPGGRRVRRPSPGGPMSVAPDRALPPTPSDVTCLPSECVLAVHLHHLQAVPPPSAGQAGADRHLAVVHAGREDRGARLQRRRQVDAAADHGRASTPSSTATLSSRPAQPSACSRRSPTSIRTRT